MNYLSGHAPTTTTHPHQNGGGGARTDHYIAPHVPQMNVSPRSPQLPSTKQQRVTTTAGVGVVTNTSCLLYTSDAADDLLCVDLGGRRIIKKKKKNIIKYTKKKLNSGHISRCKSKVTSPVTQSHVVLYK
eukprot:TRINITY_DN1320_c0_g1_i1.p1 TRINITY_DN1320_c0_g1~~TRINITY_DN1320_c0_g1_i1.p1  ORF type:complete len:130 (+),score=35.64 TRINITY_DN1320_c0_g1_i1:193-582(+)